MAFYRSFALAWCVFFIVTAIAAAGALPVLRPGATVAVFDFVLHDSSTEGAYHGRRADETARLALLTGDARAAFRRQGFWVTDLTDLRPALAEIANIADCNGCAVDLARRAGAAYAVTGLVQKTSNLILAIRLEMFEVASGRPVRAMVVDIRGNNDATWRRGLRYIFKRHVFSAP